MINLSKPALPILALSLVALVGIIVLAVLQQPIPDVLNVVAYAGLTGAAGVTVPNHTHDAAVVTSDGTRATVPATPVALVPAVDGPVFPVPPASQMAAKRGPYIKDRRLALFGGYAGVAVGAWLLYDAYERRGRTKPFIAKMVPGA